MGMVTLALFLAFFATESKEERESVFCPNVSGKTFPRSDAHLGLNASGGDCVG